MQADYLRVTKPYPLKKNPYPKRAAPSYLQATWLLSEMITSYPPVFPKLRNSPLPKISPPLYSGGNRTAASTMHHRTKHSLGSLGIRTCSMPAHLPDSPHRLPLGTLMSTSFGQGPWQSLYQGKIANLNPSSQPQISIHSCYNPLQALIHPLPISTCPIDPWV